METVRPYSNANSLEIVLREGLQERNISGGIDRNFYETWRRSWENFSCRMPGCESSADAQTWFLLAVNGILSEPAGGTIGICSHGTVIGLLLNTLDFRFGIKETEALRTPDVHAISTDHRETPVDMGDGTSRSFAAF